MKAISNAACCGQTEAVYNVSWELKSQRTLEIVASNPTTPEKLLAHLSQHEVAEIRLAVAENPATPLTVLLAMTRLDDPDLRLAMAENPNLPQIVLSLLAEDDNPYISCKAISSIQLKNNAPAKLRLVAGPVVQGHFKKFINTLTRLACIS